MLGFGDIAKDCGLSAVAAKKCKAELEKTVSQKGKSGGVETVAELTKQRDARVIASLTPPQKQRLTELSYQAIGILAVDVVIRIRIFD